MKRRTFLRNSSMMSLPFFLGGIPVNSFSRSSFTQLLEGNDDKVLVLIQLNGGNDGLQTIIPLDQYEHLVDLRSNIILPETSIIKITEENGLHPAFGLMKELYDEQKMTILQGVAYPNQNRSHFRSTDIWHTASDAEEFLDTGWMGRHFNQDHPAYPENYPNPTYPDPIAITLGLQVSETCQGPIANYSIALNGEDSLRPVEETEGGVADNSCYAKELNFIRDTIKQLNAYSEVVTQAFEKGRNQQEYAEGNNLAQQLKIVAKLISGGLQTKLYIVSIGGFDTHANQVDVNDNTEGEHASLLQELAEGIHVFQRDLESQGLEERVVGMTYSEFGRRIRSNGSRGTDHGTAAPLILFGNCVNNGIVGSNPDLSGDITNDEGVAMQYDFRSVYASLLMDWFGADETDLRDYLYNDFQYIPLIQGCATTSTDEPWENSPGLNLYPNPANEEVFLTSSTFDGEVKVSIFNTIGARYHDGRYMMNTGLPLRLDTSTLPSGNYVVRIEKGAYVLVKKLVKYQ